MDRNGVILGEPKYREIKIDNDGTVHARQSATWLFLDGQHTLTQKVNADSISGIRKNLLKLVVSGITQLTDLNLKPVSFTKISSLENFVTGNAIFSIDQKYGVIRSNGTVVVEPKYSNLKWDNNFLI